LEMLQRRVDDGEVKVSDLDTLEIRGPDLHGEEEDDKSIWDILAEQLEREEEHRQRNVAQDDKLKWKEEREQHDMKKIHEHIQESREECGGNFSSQECAEAGDSNDGTTSTRTVDVNLSSSSTESSMTTMIDRMKKDIEFLRRKAQVALSEEERASRLHAIRKMEKGIKAMTSQPQ